MGLCVYSSTVFPFSPLPLVTAPYRFWEEGVILSSPCTWAPQMQSPYHLDVTCIWYLAWIRRSIKVCGMINITFLLDRKKIILPPALKERYYHVLITHSWLQLRTILEMNRRHDIRCCSFSKWLPWFEFQKQVEMCVQEVSWREQLWWVRAARLGSRRTELHALLLPRRPQRIPS